MKKFEFSIRTVSANIGFIYADDIEQAKNKIKDKIENNDLDDMQDIKVKYNELVDIEEI